jgi:hypothetical protein
MTRKRSDEQRGRSFALEELEEAASLSGPVPARFGGAMTMKRSEHLRDRFVASQGVEETAVHRSTASSCAGARSGRAQEGR